MILDGKLHNTYDTGSFSNNIRVILFCALKNVQAILNLEYLIFVELYPTSFLSSCSKKGPQNIEICPS